MDLKLKRLILDIALFLVANLGTFALVRHLMMRAKPVRKSILPHLKNLDLNEQEAVIAAEVCMASGLTVKFADIAGLDNIIASLNQHVISPLVHPGLFIVRQAFSRVIYWARLKVFCSTVLLVSEICEIIVGCQTD